MQINGKAVIFGDNINTDVIIPSKYLTTLDRSELAKHVMESLDPNFAEKAREGVIIVAGKNFGCGSSREQAPLVLKHVGVSAIIAKSFARIFYRNAINLGLPVIECVDAERIEHGDMLRIDLEGGFIKNLEKNEEYRFKPFPEEIWVILSSGGLVSYVKKYGKLPW